MPIKLVFEGVWHLYRSKPNVPIRAGIKPQLFYRGEKFFRPVRAGYLFGKVSHGLTKGGIGPAPCQLTVLNL